MTANNDVSADLTAARSLRLLEDLTSAAARHAAAEEVLTKDARVRRLTLERRHKETVDAFEEQFTKESAAVDALWMERWEHSRDHFDRRHLRIERAERNSQRDMPRRIEAARADWLGGLQRDRLAQERVLTQEAGRKLEELECLKSRLDEAGARLKKLRRRAGQAFKGMPSLLPRTEKSKPQEDGAAQSAERDIGEVEAVLPLLEEKLDEFRKLPLPRFFSILTPPVLIGIILAGALILAGSLGFAENFRLAGGVAGAALALLAAVYLPALKSAGPAGEAVSSGINRSAATVARLYQQVEREEEAERTRLKAAHGAVAESIHAKWDGVEEVDTDFAEAAREKLRTQVPRLSARNEAARQARRAELEKAHSEASAACEARFQPRRAALQARLAAETEELATAEAERRAGLETTWQEKVPPLYAEFQRIREAALPLAPPWSGNPAEAWVPAVSPLRAMPLGRISVDLAEHAGALPRSPQLALPGPSSFDLPLSLVFPQQGSLLLESEGSAQGSAAEILNNMILRLLAAGPPGKASFTIIDPVGLGQNFGGLMNLSDYEDSLINHRIWTQRDQIDERLGILTGHIEKVIQMYLRNEFETITEYNSQAGTVAEKYHFLVIADYPHNFSETAVKRLESIVASGPRCGVFTLMHTDLRAPQPDGFSGREASPGRISLRLTGGAWELPGVPMQGLSLTPEAPPAADRVLPLLQRIGQASIDAGRVEVPFARIAPEPAAYWTGETTQELRIAIGRTGATKNQMLAIGKGTRQHALFAGKTGSGKSTLFHVIITNLALTFSPDQVEFYLIDFKKGVEFKCYANRKLPHAKVVAIESDREFALSVLHRLDEELKRRGDRFRELNVQDLAGYQKSGAREPMPRSLLIIDEFQEFFTEDDTIAQTASLLLDRIVRQGRAFGVHVLLGSQTLGGAYSLARATLGQMTIRVALQCNEADAYLIMDDNNPAPRLLSRPGEGIYNDAAGSVEGNSPFQVVWLPDDERDRRLEEIRQLAEKSGKSWQAPVVFEGNAPADPRDNPLLARVLAAATPTAPAAGRCWLGAPNAIKGPTEAVFHRQSGQHLLIVGQREEASLTMLGYALMALAGQYPAGGARFHLFHSATPGTAESEFIDQLAAAVPGLHQVRPNEAVEAVQELGEELKGRSAQGTAAAGPQFILIHGLHRFKKLRQEDDFSFSMDSDSGASPGAVFNELIQEGSSQGLHLLVSLDTFNNVNRSLSRKALTEFEMRVVFQMSANDSASLIDSPAAGNLGLHRALFHNEHDGTLETFRPYAPPDTAWLEELATRAGLPSPP